MTLHLGQPAQHRGLALLAIPLVAVLGVCAGCSASTTQSLGAPSSSANAENYIPLPNGSDSSGTDSTQGLADSDSSASAAKPSAQAGSDAKNSVASDAAQPSATVAPMASAAGTTITAIPSETPAHSKPTTALYQAVEESNLGKVNKAIKAGADLSAQDSAGRTPMMRAVIDGESKIAKVLLDAGSDPNAKDAYQESAFLRASAKGMVSTINDFLAKGADLQATNRVGDTALAIACESGQVAAVRALLKTDIPVDQFNDLGWTALHEIIVLGQGTTSSITIARLLLANGANPNLKDQTGSDAFELASDRQQGQMLTMLQAASNN